MTERYTYILFIISYIILKYLRTYILNLKNLYRSRGRLKSLTPAIEEGFLHYFDQKRRGQGNIFNAIPYYFLKIVQNNFI